MIWSQLVSLTQDWSYTISHLALKFDNVELQNKLRRMAVSINRTFCLFDEFECLYEENKPMSSPIQATQIAIMPATTTIETQTECAANDSIIGKF